MDPAAGGGFLMLFVGVVTFSIYRSQKRLKTILFALAAMAIGFGIPGIAALFLPAYAAAFGTIAALLIGLFGMSAALVHSGRSRTK